MSALVQGLLIGFFTAAPIGVLSFFCLQQAVRGGVRLGFATGLGISSANFLYGIFIAFGMHSFQECLFYARIPLLVLAGIALACLAYIRVSDEPYMKLRDEEEIDIVQTYVTSFLLAFMHPEYLLDSMSFCMAYSIDHTTLSSLLILVSGALLGSLFWYFLASWFSYTYRDYTTPEMMQYSNYVAGGAYALFGLALLAKAGMLFACSI